MGIDHTSKPQNLADTASTCGRPVWDTPSYGWLRPMSSVTLRDPDFLIIGAMKSGTTALAWALGSLPEVELAQRKEVNFFSDDENWNRGVTWYQSNFSRSALMSGEASPSYTFPENADRVAQRIRSLYPEIRLIFTGRDPLERARSQYRHEVQRGRENRPFSEALDKASVYVTRSLYGQNLAPFFALFEPQQLLIIRFEDLISRSPGGWPVVLKFLGLPSYSQPPPNHTPSVEKRRYSKAFIKLWKSGALERTRFLPRPIRHYGKLALTSDSPKYRRLLGSSLEEFPAEIADLIRADTRKLESTLGRNLWDF